MNDPPNKQKDFQDGKQQRKMIFIQTRSQAAAVEAALISHPPYCWWAKSCVASSLAWLAQKADSLWGKNEEFHHKHAWLRNRVWSLLTLFAQALAGPFWQACSLSPPLMVGNSAKYFQRSKLGFRSDPTEEPWRPKVAPGTQNNITETVTLMDLCFFQAKDRN